MKFFDAQKVARRQSRMLLLGFVAAMLLMGLVIHIVVAGLSTLFGDSAGLLQPTLPAMALIGIVWLTILAGCFFRSLDVRAGGPVLARRFGAVHASDRSRHEFEKQLINVVAEVSIAANCQPPEVFVLRRETSINAFVVGTIPGKQAIVVSQGALDAYDREQLQAVVAHEIGHISQGDLPLNMRLLIVLGGLMAIDEVGCLLIGKGPDSFAHPGVLVGYVLRALGSIGVISGRIICASFSRQREYLADSMAVQFTRNPQALAAALTIIKVRGDETSLHSPHAEALAHLCFHTGGILPWYRQILASHPPLQTRIDTIDPYFAARQRGSARVKDQGSGNGTLGGGGVTNGIAGVGLSGAGQLGAGLVSSDINVSGLSDKMLLVLADETSCLAALFALFASDDPIKRKDYLSAISFSFNQHFANRIKEISQELDHQLKGEQLGIIEHSASLLLKSIKFENRQRILLKLERLLSANDDYDLMRYATLQLIRRKLDVEFPVIETLAVSDSSVAEGRFVKTFDAMGQEFALLLSLMVESSGAPPEELDAEFNRVLKCYTQTQHPRRTGNETGIVKELEAAFQTLYVQPKPIRQAFVQHCVEIVRQDGHIARAEQALLNLFAASLGCEELAA